MLTSADTGWKAPLIDSDSTISNCLYPFGGRSKTRKSSIWARGGVSSCKAWVKADNASGRPSTSISTPAEVLRTQPVNSNRWANPYTKGLNPTPCTIPVICILKPLLFTRYYSPGASQALALTTDRRPLTSATCHSATCHLPPLRSPRPANPPILPLYGRREGK